MSGLAKAFMQEFYETKEGRELAERALLAMRLGQLVYTMRTAAGLSQADLAGRVNSTQSAISRLEGGNAGHIPGNELLQQVAQNCGYRLVLRALPTGRISLEDENQVTEIDVELTQEQVMERV